MSSIKIKELLMDAITNFVIAEIDGEYAVAYCYMKRIDAYFRIMGDYSRLKSPWESLWRQVSPLYNDYIKKC